MPRLQRPKRLTPLGLDLHLLQQIWDVVTTNCAWKIFVGGEKKTKQNYEAPEWFLKGGVSGLLFFFFFFVPFSSYFTLKPSPHPAHKHSKSLSVKLNFGLGMFVCVGICCSRINSVGFVYILLCFLISYPVWLVKLYFVCSFWFTLQHLFVC